MIRFIHLTITSEHRRKVAKTIVRIFVLLWLPLQAWLAISGWYSRFDVMPPRILLSGILPMLVLIIILFLIPRTRNFIKNMRVISLTYIHWIRIPVELVLWQLASHQIIPDLLTFEGRNFDILAGISAPIMGYLVYKKGYKMRMALIVWNIVSLGLLINIVLHAILSGPFPFQVIFTEVSNTTGFLFPFTWLPSFIVPVVLFSHIASLSILLSKRAEKSMS